MPNADGLWARVQAAEKQAQAALDQYEAFGVVDPSSEGSAEYEQAHAACHAAWVDAEEARHDLDAYLNPERYADSGYMAEALDGFRSRSGPDAKMGERTQEAGHVDPTSAARWRQAQTELVGLIREANRSGPNQPGAERKELLPASLGDWMAARAAELEQAESSGLEIEQPG